MNRKLLGLLFFLVVLLLSAGFSPVQAQSFRFVSWADTKNSRDVLASLSNQIVSLNLNPVFTIYPGDLEDNGFTTSGMNLWKNALNGGSSPGNGMFDITLPVRGNHDSNSATNWQNYFNMAATVQRVGATNYTALNEDLTYSFDYNNSRFIGVDVPGSASGISSAQVSWINGRLADAESRGLTHAFIFFHGPIYWIANHSFSWNSNLTNLIGAFNNHPIVSATFHGHEHAYAWTHIDSGRIPSVTHEFEQLVTGSAGAGPTPCNSGRCDYDLGSEGFATINVDGNSFTVRFYARGSNSPDWTSPTFTKSGGGTPQSTPTSGSSTPTVTPTPKDPDLDGDGQVNQSDMRKLLLVWGSISSSSVEDLDSNGKVNSRDAGIIIANWTGSGPPTATPTCSGGSCNLDHAICNPDRGSSAFTTNITNQFLPFSTGMQNDHIIYNSSTKERVRFRILSQTKSIAGADGVDPVQALVLEEYETVNNQWVETSHNWFVQTLNGTVCYFGEDVFLPGSPGGGGGGSWEAGKNGAKAGIMMPPNPAAGMTWMIEDAPNARENAEVSETGVTFTTPAGTFSNVVYIKEDFSGGQWNSFKRYAPGVGMIYDDGLVLTSY